MSISDFSPSRQALDELAARIRDAHKAVLAAVANALAAALDAGDAVLELQRELQSRGIGWQAWFREWGHLPLSTAKLYARLAAHRDEIEAERARLPELSLRAACRLIGKPQPAPEVSQDEPPAEPKPIEAPEPAATSAARIVIRAISKMTDAELTAVLAALPFDRFLRCMPSEWRPKLELQAGGQLLGRVKSQHPNIRLKRLSKRHLTLVHTAETPTPH
jgi:hypothetical protein